MGTWAEQCHGRNGFEVGLGMVHACMQFNSSYRYTENGLRMCPMHLPWHDPHKSLPPHEVMSHYHLMKS